MLIAVTFGLGVATTTNEGSARYGGLPMGANPKSKGSSGERQAATVLEQWAAEVGVTIKLERNLNQTRGGGYDLVSEPPCGLGIEIKRVEQLAINSWWRQCVRQADADGTLPFLMHRRNRQKWCFRVRAQCVQHSSDKWNHFHLDVDLDLVEGKKWFQHYILLQQAGVSLHDT